ncbi:CIC11C00000003780 [Sungouiella intermedia]|uniref:CIC11C00000003780 n=1 Tax=Sungouiella intermedia TaxID=45354 RepID=A0A1L0C0B2_9ASCO|nr:CIC11C00000003780 [[Candida] intermedia]
MVSSTIVILRFVSFFVSLSKVTEAQINNSPCLSQENQLVVYPLDPRDDDWKNFNFRSILQSPKNALRAESGDPPGSSSQTFVVPNRSTLRDSDRFFKSKDNIIKLEDTNEVIYYDEGSQKWYLHLYNKENDGILDENTQKVPVSWCLDMTDGNEGYISPLIEIELTSGGSSGISGGFAGLGQYKGDILKLAFGVSLSTSVKFSGGVTCIVKAGQYGQVFIQPYVYKVPKGKRVQVQFEKGKGLIEKGKWEKTESYNRYWIRPPMVECAVSYHSLLCTGFFPR